MSKNIRTAFYDAESFKWYELISFEINKGMFSNILYKDINNSFYGISNYILPGFIDAHVHILENPYIMENSKIIYNKTTEELFERAKMNLRDALRCGVTSVKDFGGRQFASISIKNKVEIEAEPLPRFFTSGCCFSKPGGHLSGRGAILIYDIDTFTNFISLLKKSGINFVKILHSKNIFSIEELKKIVNISHDNDMIVSIHAYQNETAMDAVLSGADIIEHVGDYSNELLTQIEINNTIVVPTYISAYDNYINNFEDFGENISLSPVKEWFTGEKIVIPKLFSKNIQVALGTDAGFSGTTCSSLYREINALNKDFGIKTENLMYSAFITTPKTIGMSKSLGKIKNGYLADFLCFDKNPIDNINVIQHPKEVWIKGEKVIFD